MLRIALSLVAATLVAFAPAYAQPADISVADYLKAWDAMDTGAIQKEMEDTGSIDFGKHPEARIVSEELERIAKAYRAQVEADRAAERTPHSCLPEGEVQLTTDDLIPHLRRYENGSEVTLATAFADLMATTYPCA